MDRPADDPVLCLVERFPVLVWRYGRGYRAISSAPYGGGIGERSWVMNATVPSGYGRVDPHAHVAELAESVGLDGAGTGMLTAVDVRHRVRASMSGVQAFVTTGADTPVWPAAPPESVGPYAPGTINVVTSLPARMSDAALVNAVATVAEAKAQALTEAGVPGTGTATDATVLVCPTAGPSEPFGGPRSPLGSLLARAVHEAVSKGLRVPLPGHWPS